MLLGQCSQGCNLEQLFFKFSDWPFDSYDFLKFNVCFISRFPIWQNVLRTGFQFGFLSGALFTQRAHTRFPGILCASPRIHDWNPVCQCKVLSSKTINVCKCFTPDSNSQCSDKSFIRALPGNPLQYLVIVYLIAEIAKMFGRERTGANGVPVCQFLFLIYILELIILLEFVVSTQDSKLESCAEQR
jgi:hypothetical protein